MAGSRARMETGMRMQRPDSPSFVAWKMSVTVVHSVATSRRREKCLALSGKERMSGMNRLPELAAGRAWMGALLLLGAAAPGAREGGLLHPEVSLVRCSHQESHETCLVSV